MGARPVALLDSLRFGPSRSRPSATSSMACVAGIGGYGNCIGVPTVGGEIYFDNSYRHNCLVNAMCVGVIEQSKLDPGGRRRSRQPRPPGRRRHRP